MFQHTHIGSLNSFRKGSLEVFADDPKHYAFSNIFDVANLAAPFERIAVTKNHQYVTEVMKVDGRSPWFASAHDEFALVMDGEVTFDFVVLSSMKTLPAGTEGAVQFDQDPGVGRVGTVKARRGHLVLLPAGRGYSLNATHPAVALIQTLAGLLTQERWADICSQ
ncbi:hydroxyquinol 1,2-dioxygenase [Verminephrobacter eiseniae]|uniref:hydroxyquinol 1,2-dioxygenase n=1 Tax=Verminephrobacter eiseniae TaxID=364317 RepID=UPI0022381593|nr:hydroxyquinol 1,2-dioxygenase [Verminephrobacter eiseniae]MCW5262002.1 hydroxyquinol 1,2-dioxygenase [Verminephrobacter eiseniae]